MTAARGSVRRQVRIARPPDEVWALVGDPARIAEWFPGWLGAACEQEPELAAETGDYSERRLAQAKAGQLAVRVGHEDILALPRSGR